MFFSPLHHPLVPSCPLPAVFRTTCHSINNQILVRLQINFSDLMIFCFSRLIGKSKEDQHSQDLTCVGGISCDLLQERKLKWGFKIFF